MRIGECGSDFLSPPYVNTLNIQYSIVPVPFIMIVYQQLFPHKYQENAYSQELDPSLNTSTIQESKHPPYTV